MCGERLAEYLTPSVVYNVVTLTFVAWIAAKYRSISRYPPGPAKWLPWIGSLVYMPKHKAWETYERWGKEYNSGILHLQGAGLNIIVLNSIEAAIDLLDNRSAIYSSRPMMSMVEMIGWEWGFGAMAYTAAWREGRKLFQKHLHPSKPEVYQSKFLATLRERLIPNLLEDPENWTNYFRHAVGSSIISLAYGIPLQENPRISDNINTDQGENLRSLDSLITLAEAAVETINIAYAEGAIIVDLIPILKHFPSWFPGLGFKAKLPEWQKLAADIRTLPFDVGESLISEGKAEESFISLCLDDEEDLEIAKDTAGAIFVGAVDTTLALLHNFIFAMLLHPEVQRRAQQELDQLLTAEKLQAPEWDDRDKLPYLTAVLNEIIRWRPILPLGVAHVVVQDDEYKGYHIPKGSFIIPNTWLMLHNEETFGKNTEKFEPERFLDEKGGLNGSMRDPADFAFGFGRRVCPGMHVGLYNLFMVASHVLCLFNIEYAVDDNGEVKMPSMDWPDLVACPPLPFECKFVSRVNLER